MTNAFENYAHVRSFSLTLPRGQALLLLAVKNCDNEATRTMKQYVPAIKALLYKGLIREHPSYQTNDFKLEISPLGTKKRPHYTLTEEGKFLLKLINKTRLLEQL